MDENQLVVAEALAQSEIEAGIRRVVAKLPKQPDGFDGLCVDCGEEIPTPRLSFGAITCLPCQELRELREKLRFIGA